MNEPLFTAPHCKSPCEVDNRCCSDQDLTDDEVGCSPYLGDAIHKHTSIYFYVYT